MKFPQIKTKMNAFLAIAALGLSLFFPALQPVFTGLSQVIQTNQFNSQEFNISTDPTTKQMRFGCSHQL